MGGCVSLVVSDSFVQSRGVWLCRFAFVLAPKGCCVTVGDGGHRSGMGGFLRAEPVWVELFTGLRMRQYRGLVKVVRERGGDHPVLVDPGR
ncbi:hypothetical protein ABIA35_009840 [Catenulispora sp. MAP12-49]